jgi:hypothetical protein
VSATIMTPPSYFTPMTLVPVTMGYVVRCILLRQ